MNLQAGLAALVGLALIAVVPNAAHAQSGTECAKVQSDAKRLECYDLIWKKTSITGTSVGRGKWKVREDVSKLDDSKNVFLSLDSSDSASNRLGQSVKSRIAIACREGKTNLWITFADNFMSDNAGGGKVTYRIDKQAAASRDFDESNDNGALGLWSGGSALPFIKEMLTGESMYVRATPFSESAVSATFDIRGLASALVPVQEACSWS